MLLHMNLKVLPSTQKQQMSKIQLVMLITKDLIVNYMNRKVFKLGKDSKLPLCVDQHRFPTGLGKKSMNQRKPLHFYLQNIKNKNTKSKFLLLEFV